MTRFITTAALAFGLAAAVSAQNTTTTTKVESKDGDVKTITYTGCVRTGTETRSFVLANVVPVSRTTTTETVGTAGATTTTMTTYALVPGEKIEFQTHVGHKVEVTGVMIPAGDSKTTTTTKVERDNAPDTKTKETVKVENAMPQFRVTSIKNLSDSCEP